MVPHRPITHLSPAAYLYLIATEDSRTARLMVVLCLDSNFSGILSLPVAEMKGLERAVHAAVPMAFWKSFTSTTLSNRLTLRLAMSTPAPEGKLLTFGTATPRGQCHGQRGSVTAELLDPTNQKRLCREFEQIGKFLALIVWVTLDAMLDRKWKGARGRSEGKGRGGKGGGTSSRSLDTSLYCSPA